MRKAAVALLLLLALGAVAAESSYGYEDSYGYVSKHKKPHYV